MPLSAPDRVLFNRQIDFSCRQMLKDENLARYTDVFVSRDPRDQTEPSAHFPTLVVEILSKHVGEEFTDKMDAYLGSTQLCNYLIVNARRKRVYQYRWQSNSGNGRRLITCVYERGPVNMPSLNLDLTFDQIYARTNVPHITRSIGGDEEAEIFID